MCSQLRRRNLRSERSMHDDSRPAAHGTRPTPSPATTSPVFTHARSTHPAGETDTRTHGLWLGWQSRDRACSFGFGAASPTAAGDAPLLYHGDGHLISVAPTGAGKG